MRLKTYFFAFDKSNIPGFSPNFRFRKPVLKFAFNHNTIISIMFLHIISFSEKKKTSSSLLERSHLENGPRIDFSIGFCLTKQINFCKCVGLYVIPNAQKLPICGRVLTLVRYHVCHTLESTLSL